MVLVTKSEWQNFKKNVKIIKTNFDTQKSFRGFKKLIPMQTT
jgi:hypothetical protein